MQIIQLKQHSSIIIQISKYLFILMPFLLISGPLLSDLSVSLISIFFLYFCIKHKKLNLFNKLYFKVFFIFWIYLLLNSLLNNFNLDSFKISFFYLRFGIFCLAIVYIIKSDEKILKYFLVCLTLCFIILIIDGYLQYFTGSNLIGFQKTGNRISSFFGDELVLGSYLSRFFPIFFGLAILFKERIKLNFNFLILFFVLIETLVFLSGERTAFFYINLSAIYTIILIKDYKKTRIITLCLTAILLILISYINPVAKDRIIDKTISQMNLSPTTEKTQNDKQINNSKNVYIFSEQHNSHYITAYRMFKDNLLFGVGVKNFRNFCSNIKYNFSEKSCSTHPHNTYIQLLSETGLIGFGFIFIFLIIFIKYTLKHFILMFRKKYYFTDFQICMMSCILILIWPAAPTGNFFNNWLSILYYLPISLIIWSFEKNKKIYF